MRWTASSIIGAVLLMLAFGLGLLAAPDDETAATQLGYACGSLFLALVLVSVGRFIQLRSARSDGDARRPFWVPEVVLAMGIVAISVVLLNLSGRAASEEDDRAATSSVRPSRS